MNAVLLQRARYTHKAFIVREFTIKELVALQMSRTSLFCKYCGSSDVVDGQVTTDQGSKKTFEPNIESISLGSISHGRKVSLTYPTKICRKCLNILAADELLPTEPMTIRSSQSMISVVIPFALSLHLKLMEYEAGEIIDLVKRIRQRLDSIYTSKYSSKGRNPCKHGRVGFKITVLLKQRAIPCWLIIDTIEKGIVYRVCYGGGKVQCH